MDALDRRLGLIYEMTRPGRAAADIGSDHGRLIAALVRSGRTPRGVATDIRPKPLQKTKELVARLGLEDRVDCLLCDGLAEVSSQMADEIIIAGMGGELIARIIDSWPYSAQQDKRFLLQPMTRPEALREYLYTHGFFIEEERCAVQSGHAYSVMAVRYTGQKREPTPRERYLGMIADFGDPASREYARRLLSRLTLKADGMEKSGKDAGGWRALAAETEKLIEEGTP